MLSLAIFGKKGCELIDVGPLMINELARIN